MISSVFCLQLTAFFPYFNEFFIVLTTMLNPQEVLKAGEKRKSRSPEAWFRQTCSAQTLHMSF
ncbi:hypothetical protein ACQWFT_25840, partial [Salmonella enterica subsp. enterica serovar Infantis]